MKVFAILLLALVCANSMSLMEKYPINFSNKRSIMTLLAQVENQLKTGGPLDAITDMLREFKTTINEEQANHDALWAEQQEQCLDETTFREEEVRNATAALEEAQETLDGCSAQKVRAESDLAITKKQLQENRSYLAQVEDSRRREAYAFETYSTSFQIMSKAIDEALVILEEIWAGEASFLQLARHTNGLLKSAIKVKRAQNLTGVLAALVQLTNKDVQADDELLNRVKTLFLGFKKRLEDDFSDASAAEQAAIQLYNEESARLKDTISTLQSQQQGLEAEIAELDKCIITQSSIVTSASLKASRNKRLLEDAQRLCASVEEEYHVATNARQEELELLNAIQERVEARFAQLSEGVTQRGMQDEFSYSNDSAYDHQKFQH